MRLSKQSLLLVALCFVFIFTACKEQSQEEYITTLYIEYADLLANDVATAASKYVHYENPGELDFAIASANNTIPNYKILEVERLTDDLWAIHVWQKDSTGLDYTIYHFVANINGTYKVVTHYKNIPQNLCEGIDLTPYAPPDGWLFWGDMFDTD